MEQILEIADHWNALNNNKSLKLLEGLNQKENVELFPSWVADDYQERGTKLIYPMLANSVKDEKVAELLQDDNWVAQHKLDGERCLFHIHKKYNRLFSRRISKQTGWLNEKTDLLPQFRDLDLSGFDGTVLDGELLHPSGEFKNVGSVLRSKPQRAWEVQKETGLLFYVVYDITHYKGISVQHKPYHERLRLLNKLVYFNNQLRSPFIVPIKTVNHAGVPIDGEFKNKEQYLQYILSKGGEGIILKDLNAPYIQGEKDKRSKGLVKVKSIDTWDVVITGYDTTLAKYDGKEIANNGTWLHWYDPYNEELIPKDQIYAPNLLLKDGMIPVTKYFAQGWIRAVKFGVVVPSKDIKKLSAHLQKQPMTQLDDEGKYVVVEIGQTSGMSDEVREKLSKHKQKYIGKVIELMANGILDKETASLRHPRYLRERTDKGAEQCTLKSHLRE